MKHGLLQNPDVVIDRQPTIAAAAADGSGVTGFNDSLDPIVRASAASNSRNVPSGLAWNRVTRRFLRGKEPRFLNRSKARFSLFTLDDSIVQKRSYDGLAVGSHSGFHNGAAQTRCLATLDRQQMLLAVLEANSSLTSGYQEYLTNK